jgi:hypothetical protein
VGDGEGRKDQLSVKFGLLKLVAFGWDNLDPALRSDGAYRDVGRGIVPFLNPQVEIPKSQQMNYNYVCVARSNRGFSLYET